MKKQNQIWKMPDVSELIKEVQSFQTTDGEIHRSKAVAEYRQEDIEEASHANKLLDEGKTIAEILEDLGRKERDPILEKVTKNSKLVISHWQCQDTPGYKPCRFERGLKIYVYGNAGSWSGPYGNSMSIEDLVRYAKHKNSAL